MFRAHVLIIRRSKLHYTASGVITSMGGRLVHETSNWNWNLRVSAFWNPQGLHRDCFIMYISYMNHVTADRGANSANIKAPIQY